MSSDHGLPRSKNHEIRKRETDFNIIYAFRHDDNTSYETKRATDVVSV